MAGRERRYALDTNVFIHAARDSGFREQLVSFHAAFAPFEMLLAVVAQELLAGAHRQASEVVEKQILLPFERRGRVLLPSYASWKATGVVLSQLVRSGPERWTAISRSFVNDILIAMSCREAGVILVTENVRDFERIAQVRPFDFVAPWPTPSS